MKKMKDIFLKLMDIQYPENLHNLHNVANLHDKTEYATRKRS